MNAFEFFAPESLDGVLDALAQWGDEAKLLAGGTGLINMMKQRLVNPAALVSLGNVPGLDHLSADTGALRVGTLCSQQAIATSPDVARVVPLLAETYGQVATPRIRNVATVGGGLVHGDPNQDPPVALLALDASVKLVSKSGERILALSDFLVDYYETATGPDEVLVEVMVPAPARQAGSAYLKFLPRSADDYATVSAAAVVTLRDGKLDDVRVAVGSAAPTALRCSQAERILTGQAPTADALRAAAATAREIADPISDGRGSAEYKRDMVPVFVRRALEKAVGRAQAAAEGR
ncbi:MAG: xanthine dehydrogenase family protein subunit M [Chloroflexota bacterium]|nr:xanthine dehydrogenase family protein subunit M [Chloroflexota bacterium]